MRGLTLISARLPGNPQIVFAVDHVERDADGDICYWELRPAPRQQVSAAATVAIRVFND